MEKNYEEFKQELRQEIMKKMNYTENQVWYMRNESETSNSERLMIEVIEHEDSTEVCGIWVNEVYKRYLDTGDLEAIVEWIVDEIISVREINVYEKVSALRDYHKVKNRLFIRPLNLEKIREELKDAVYQVVGDIAKVLYFKVAESDAGVTSTKVCKKFLELWGLDAESVMEAALVNTAHITPPRIYTWEKMIFDPEGDGEEINAGINLEEGPLGNCLSTTCRTNGAVAIFLPGVAKCLGELLDADLYMVFTSIHEVMVHSTKTASADVLERILADTLKNTTNPEDYLTSTIYRYYRDQDAIFPVRCDEV